MPNPMLLQALEMRVLLAGTISQQIIVDQFGYRAGATKKVAIFADPISGQNSAVAYTPGATFQVRRAADDVSVFTGNTVIWNAGATDTISGDKVWRGDFSAVTTPGEYYLYDSTNNLRSYTFKIDDAVNVDILKTSMRTYYYQRTGTAIDAAHGGNWTHAIDHVGPNQDTQARLWQNGAVVAGAPVRDLSGGWFDAGDYNKYVPFTSSVLWNLLSAYEWNGGSFGDNYNIPESGNAVPDVLDEIKYELDWLLKMQNANGSVLNRVSNQTYATGNFDPSTDTQPRYYTRDTTWATASFAASLAQAARVFAKFDPVYPGYSATLLTARAKRVDLSQRHARNDARQWKRRRRKWRRQRRARERRCRFERARRPAPSDPRRRRALQDDGNGGVQVLFRSQLQEPRRDLQRLPSAPRQLAAHRSDQLVRAQPRLRHLRDLEQCEREHRQRDQGGREEHGR